MVFVTRPIREQERLRFIVLLLVKLQCRERVARVHASGVEYLIVVVGCAKAPEVDFVYVEIVWSHKRLVLGGGLSGI